MKPVSGAWRGFSLDAESAFGTPQTVDNSLPFGGSLMDTKPGKVWDNRDEYTGDLAPSQIQTLTWATEGKHTQLLQPHNAALFLSWLLGKSTPSTLDAGPPAIYQHLIQMDKSVITIPSRTVREFDGVTYLEYPGVICTAVSISGEREDFVKLDATLLGMGQQSVVTPDPARPSQVTESYLTYGDVTIKKGGTYNGTTVSGGTDISARVKNFKMDLSNGAKQKYNFGDNSGYAGDAYRGRLLGVNLEMSLEFEDQAEKASLAAGDTFVLEIPMVGGLIDETYRYSVKVVLPKVAYNKTEKAVDDGLLLLNAGFTVLADPTYGVLDIRVINKQASYL